MKEMFPTSFLKLLSNNSIKAQFVTLFALEAKHAS
jgi:hypothetical protein